MRNAREFFKAMLAVCMHFFEEFMGGWETFWEEAWPVLDGPICGVLCAIMAYKFIENGKILFTIIAFVLGWIVVDVCSLAKKAMWRAENDGISYREAVRKIRDEVREERRDY